ncbi:hypothetical protein [Enterococcus sp. LJL90]
MIIVCAVAMIILAKWLLPFLIFALLTYVFLGNPEDLLNQLARQKEEKNAKKQPLPLWNFGEFVYYLLDYLNGNDYIKFQIDYDEFYTQVMTNSVAQDLGATVVISLRKTLNAELIDSEQLSFISKQFLRNQQQTPLGLQNKVLQRILFETVDIDDNFVNFKLHDKQFYLPLNNSNDTNLDDDFYA